jgi:outer membrane protein OmpA-like peptidoglycan-associated protein
MSEDWAIDVRKYAPDADDAVIAGIVRHCGIALRSRDASLVSFTDPAETERVRESFLRRKLGLTDSDAVLDEAIAAVGERMSADRTKNRVTVYYLLAEMFGKLGLFGGAAAAAAEPAEEADPALPLVAPADPPLVAPVDPPVVAPVDPPVVAPVDPPVVAPVDPPVVAPALAAAAAVPLAASAAAAAPIARPVVAAEEPAERDRGGIGGTALAVLGVLGLAILGTATVGSLMSDKEPEIPAVPVSAVPAPVAPAPAAPAIPEGSGVVAEEVAGKPQLSVYFDTASAEVSPDFATAAGPIKAWIDANPGDRLAVSGYNDPRGDAAFNAELSKNRAEQVAAALARLGVPPAAIDLVKPAETTDTDTSLANARRVDIVVVTRG